ncbi:MAG TPA: hypothetical protein VK458_21965 [Myxococcaceae bacterium]|nr:hypothetical protein [Myxococcaceae bacterium]
MKMLLVALQLSLTPPVPVPGADSVISTPPSENKQVRTIDFEDDSIAYDLVSPNEDPYPGCRQARWSPLIRIREDFDDKVMQSVREM